MCWAAWAMDTGCQQGPDFGDVVGLAGAVVTGRHPPLGHTRPCCSSGQGLGGTCVP